MRISKWMKPYRLFEQAGEHGSDAGTGAGTGVDEGIAAAAAAETAASKAAALAAAAVAKPSEAEAKLLKDMMKQKTRASELEVQLAAVSEKLKTFEGIDAAKVKTLMAEQEEIERKRLIAEGDFDRLTKQMAERHTAEKTTMLEQIAVAVGNTKSLQQQIADLTVGGSFTSSKFVTEELTLTPSKARVIYGAHFEFKDGAVVGFDKPVGASDRTMLVNSTGNALSFEDAMKKIVEADPDRDELIRSKMKPGAGSSATKPAKKSDSEQSSSMTGVEKIAAGLKALASKR